MPKTPTLAVKTIYDGKTGQFGTSRTKWRNSGSGQCWRLPFTQGDAMTVLLAVTGTDDHAYRSVIKLQVGYPSSESLGTRTFQSFNYSRLWDICICIKYILRIGPKSN